MNIYLVTIPNADSSKHFLVKADNVREAIRTVCKKENEYLKIEAEYIGVKWDKFVYSEFEAELVNELVYDDNIYSVV